MLKDLRDAGSLEMEIFGKRPGEWLKLSAPEGNTIELPMGKAFNGNACYNIILFYKVQVGEWVFLKPWLLDKPVSGMKETKGCTFK